MLPSTGHFKGFGCPFLESGLCERPYCHFKHVRREIPLRPTGPGPGLETVSRPTYNPTPISELNKKATDGETTVRRHIPVPYTPYRPSVPLGRRPRTETYIPGGIPNSDATSLAYEPTGIISNDSEYSPTSLKYEPGGPAAVDSVYSPTSPASVVPSSLQYTPTPLRRDSPNFSSDDEPDSKKIKIADDTVDFEGLESEFEILGQIIEDEERETPPEVINLEHVNNDSKDASKKKTSFKDKKKEKSREKSESKSRENSSKKESDSHRRSESKSSSRGHSSKERGKSDNKHKSDSKHVSEKRRSDDKHKSDDRRKSESSSKEQKSHSKSKSDSSKRSSDRSNRSSSDRSSSKSKTRSSSEKHKNKDETKKSALNKSKTISKEHKSKREPESKKLNEILFETDIEEFSDSDCERRDEECRKIFEEYIPTPKEILEMRSDDKQDIESDDILVNGKKRIAHTTDLPVKRLPTVTLPPNHKTKAVHMMADRYNKVRQFHESRVKVSESQQNTSANFMMNNANSSSKIRIAHVPYVSNLLNAKKNLAKPVETQKTTAIQTVAKGASRVAHIPNEKFCDRPGVLEPMGSKIAANVRAKYLNMMIDECLKIYLTAEDAYERAQQEELTTSKKCSAIPIYRNSAVIVISRLRKEIQENDGNKKSGLDSPTNVVSHNKILAGKIGEKVSWSIENRYKKDNQFSDELRGFKFYNNIHRWILTEQELRDNGFPRPHTESNERGRAIIYSKNTRQKPPKGNIRSCCRCNKEYKVDKKGFAIVKEECIYHPNNKYRFRGEVKYQCCNQDGTSDGCLSASCHVYEYVDHDNLRGFVKTLPKDDDSDENVDHGVYALDCEMCYTTHGLELTRVTVIDSSCKVVYESLVKPLYPIIDYNTRYSGLTEENMSNCTTTLLEVQATFLHMFSDKTILVGHSLESDFKALKLIHDTIVDTSVLFPHKMGPPYKRALRNLSSDYLKKIIQNSVDGHDSAEDALVCMELLMWKLKEELKLR